MAAAGNALLPSQPYNILPRMHPGEKLLLRVVRGGREMHPFHTTAITRACSPVTAVCC